MELRTRTPTRSPTFACLVRFQDNEVDNAVAEITKLYKLFVDVDSTQVEINPLGPCRL